MFNILRMYKITLQKLPIIYFNKVKIANVTLLSGKS